MSSGKSDKLTCSLLTPAGTGAIAVVELRGMFAWNLIQRRINTKSGSLPDTPSCENVYYGTFIDRDEPIDDVLISCTSWSHKEDQTVEISCHGGVRIVERILVALTDADGVKLVDYSDSGLPIGDWRDAIYRDQQAMLARATTRRTALALMKVRSLLFDEIELIIRKVSSGDMEGGLGCLQSLFDRSTRARYLFQPARVVLAGPPNVGKSFLANRLAQVEGAIVSERAGTTRDWVSFSIALNGVPINLVDTAGLRDTSDGLEAVAIKAGQKQALDGDLFLYVVDVSTDLHWDAISKWRPQKSLAPTILVLNKKDLGIGGFWKEAEGYGFHRVIEVSALRNEGMELLQYEILGALGLSSEELAGAVIFSKSMLDRVELLLNCVERGEKLSVDLLEKSLTGRKTC